MKKTLQLLSLLALMCVPWVTQAQETLTVADGTATNNYVPVYGLYCDDYQKAHFVYPSDLLGEMSSGSQISQMVFYLSSAPAAAWTGSFNIYLSEVDYTSISAYADVNTMQQVYTGTLDATSGTMTVEFDATYTYNGGNLLVAFEEYQDGSYKSASFYGISSNGSCVSGYNGSSLSNVSTNQRNFLPKVTFTYIPGGGALICTKPATLNVFDITSGGASFSWSSTDAGLYQFETKMAADSVWSVWAPQTDTFATFSFESNTAYNARVKALCSDSLESGYRSVNFRTPCAPLNEDMLPYVEDFEGYGTGSSQSISPCWAKGTNNTTAYPYPYSTAAINGERGLYFYGYHTSSASSTMTYSWAALPPVDESVDISSLMLTFNAKRYSSTSTYYHSTIMVGIAESVESLTSAGVIDSMVTWMGYYDLTTEDAGTVIEERVSLANYQGNGKYIVFYCPSPEITSGTYAYNYIYIDDVVLRDIPTCSDVTGLIASDITAESITLTWDYAADSYTLYNMADGSVLGTMTDTAYTIAGLAPTTNYTFGVAANCGSEQGYMTTITVRTACGAFSVPYTWTFEDDATNANPSCWTKEGAGSATVTSSSSNSHSGSMYLKFSGSTSNLVVLPLTEAEINTLQLRFWTRPESYTNSSCGTFSVGYMVDTTFVEVANYAYDDFNTYTEKIVNFTNAPAGARIAMRHNAGSSSWYWYVDDVTVMEAPECAEVIQITEEVTNCGSYTWNGQAYNQSGLYNITLQAENGCDSVINTLVLTVNQPVYVERSVVAEDSYTWNGVTYTESGSYSYMTTAANGCDSITILNLTINTTCTGNYCNITIVGSDSYGDGWNGNAINVVQGGNIIGTFTIENGSDFTSEFNVCSSLPVSFHWVSGNYAYETSFQILDGGGTEVYVGLDAQSENFFTLDNACPSCLPVNGLSVTSTTNSATLYWYADTIESGITYNIYVNDNLYASGVSDNYYVVSNLASNTEYTLGVQLVCSADDASTVTTVDVRTACDGISYQTFEAAACGNYYYEGYTFTESGVYGDTIYDEYGCMVARTLVLTIYPEYYDTIQATGTNYFVWYGDTLTGDGIYPHIGESVNSCDSIEFLMLSINYDMACGEGVSSITAKNADASDATIQYVPGYSLYNYSYSEVIIPAESLEGIGTVKALQFKPASTNGGNMFTNCEVYLANTSNDNLSTGFTADRSSFQQVWSGDMNYTSTDWQTLMFTTPFVWDGTSNIVVAVIRNHGSYASGSSFEAYTADAQLARYAYQDNTPYTISDVSAGNANVSNTPAWYKLLGCNDGAVISCARVRDQYAEAASNSVALYWSDQSNTGATYSVYSITDSDTMLVASNIADTMYVVSNLEANTPYQFAIEANCGVGDASTMARVSVRTQCAAISSLPYTTSFEADELVGTTAVDALPWCWTRYNDATSGTSYPYSISSSYAHTGSRLLYFYTTTSATYANVEMAIMPIIDVNVLPLNTLRLRFYARSSSSGNGIIEVGTVSDPTDPTTFTYVQSFSVIGTEHELKTVTGFPTNGDQYIAFRMLRDTATYHYVYIDDLTLDAIPSCLEPNDFVVTNVTENSASIEWTGNAATYLVTCDSMQYVVEGTSFTVTGLASSTDYTVGVQAVCSAADISSAVYVTFRTSGIPAELPYYTSFEEGDDQGWEFVNGTNGWAIGNATAVNGTNALYISNDNGVSNSYTISGAASTSYAYRTIRIDEPGQYNISYCWKGQGESSWDFLRAWLAPANAQFVANTYPDNATTYQNGYSPDGWLDLGGRMNLNSEWQCFSHMVDVATPGNYNVVFMWRNDNSGGNNPPIAVDNVEVAHVSCPNPVYPLLTSTAYSITATWEPGGNENAWVLELVDAASGSVVDNAVASDTMYTFDGLNSNTGYVVYIRALCDEGDTSTSIGSWITTEVSCMTVKNMTVSVGDTSVFVAWSDTSASEWDVVVVDQGNGLDSALLSFTSYGTSVELANMEAGSYYLYVRARCSEEEVSEWAGPVAFTIAAVVPPVEMTCDGSNPITVGNTDASDATNQYIPGYSYYEYSYSEVIIPAESLAGIGTVKALQFKPTTADGGSYFTNCEVYLANTSADNLEEGFVQDPNSFQLVWSGDMSYSTDDWQTLVFNSPFVWDGASNIVVAVNRGHGAWTNGSSFAAYTAESQLGRYVYRDGTPYAIGSITGGTAVNTPAWYKLQGCDDGAVITCARVRDQYAEAASNSVTLYWSDPSNTGATYSVYNITASDTVLVASNIADTQYVVGNLEANTQYLFAIEANCGVGDASTMARVSVRTQCAAIGSLPYTTSFEAAELQGTDALQAIPWCWTRINNLTSGDNYYPYAYASSYSNYAHEGVYCMEFYASTWGTYADTTGLVLPALDVTSYPMDGNRVSFWAKKNSYSNDSNSFTILVGTMANPADMSTFAPVQSVVVDATEYTKYTVSLAGANATDAYVALLAPKVNGTMYLDDLTLEVLPECADVTGLTLVNVTENSATISWNAVADSYTLTIDGSTVTTYDTTYTFTGLSDATSYTCGVATNCGGSLGLTAEITFSTSAIPAVLPYATGFEGEDAGWLFVDGVNAWVIGSDASHGGANALYVSNDGETIGYSINQTSVSYAYRTLHFDAAGSYSVSFDWAGQGESNYDYMRAWLAPVSFQFAAGKLPDGTTSTYGYTTTTPVGWYDLGGKMNMSDSWQTNGQVVNIAEAGNYNLVFMWCNDNGAGANPPVAVDNVSVMPLSCPAVANLTATGVTASEATIAWSYNNDGAYGYEVYLNGEYINNVYDNNSYTFTNLNSEMTYTAGVRALCSDGDTSMMATTQFTTSMGCGNGTCVVTIVGHDSYGDGWNGNAINIVQNGETVGTFTLSDGSDQTTGYCVTEGQPISFSWTTGSYSYETSFQVVNAEGVTVADISDGSVLTGGETFLALDNCNSIPTDVYDTIDIVACGSYWWNKTNNEYTESGVYTVQTSNALGYSSYTTLNLTINPNYYSNDTVVAVGSYYDEANDIFATQGSWYYRSYQTVDGCDSTVGYNIIITPYATTDTQHVTACEYYNYGYGYYAYGSGIYEYDSVLGELYLYDTVYYYDTVYEYDSMMVYTWYNLEQVYNLDAKLYHFVLDLTIKNNVWSETYDTTYADYYVWNGDTLRNSSWMYSHNYPGAAANGCDSTAYLTLTILSGDVRYATACDYFNANGRWFYQSGIHYYDSTICDSVNRMEVYGYDEYVYDDSTGNGYYVTRYDTSYYTDLECYNRTFTLDLTINHSTWHDDTIYAVDYYVFGGDTLTNSGWYEHSFPVPGGCDSNAYISLVIISGDTINVTACDWYETSNGWWYYESGLYYFDSTDADGITRTYVLNLTINHNYWFDTSVITPDYYVFGGDTLTESGWYEKTFTAVNGCDSTIGLNLDVRVIHELTVNTNGGYLYVGALGENIRSDTVLMVGQGYQFLQLVTFDPVTGGYYDVDGEHSRLYELYIDGQPVDLSESVSNDVYTLNIYNYLASSGYNIYNIYLNMYGDHSIEAVYGPYYNDSVCLTFGHLQVYDVTHESATVSWTAGSGVDTYVLSYGNSDNFVYDDVTGTYYFEGDYATETVTGTDTVIIYQLSGLQYSTDYVVLLQMTCDGGEQMQGVYYFTTNGLPHTITVTNNGGSAWREELDRLDTTVVFTGHEGESFFTYLYSHMPETDSMWYGRTDRCQLHNIIIDGDTIDVLQNSSSDVYDLWVNQDGDYIYYELNVYYNADHIVEYVFGPYDGTMWPEYCMAPNLWVDDISEHSAAIAWDQSDDSVEYIVSLYNDGEMLYCDTVFATGYYEFNGLTSNTYYTATVSTVCPNGTLRTSSIDVQTYSVPHTITLSSNGGYVWANNQVYTQPVELTLSGHEGESLEVGLVSFLSDPQGVVYDWFGVDEYNWKLKHLYVDGVDILSQYNDSVGSYEYYAEEYEHEEGNFTYIYHSLNLQYDANHSVVAEFGPFYDDSACVPFGHVQVYDESVDGAMVSWTAGSGADSYLLSYGYRDNLRYDDAIGSYYFEGDYTTVTVAGGDTIVTYQIGGLESSTEYALILDMTCVDGMTWQRALGFTTTGIPHNITVTNNGGSAWRPELDRLDTTVVYPGHEGEYFYTYLYSHLPSDDSIWYGRTDRCQLQSIIIDGNAVDITQSSSGNGYYLSLAQDGNYVWYFLEVYYNTDHDVQFVFGPYDETVWPQYCVAPENLRVENVTDHSVAVAWDPADSAWYLFALYDSNGEVVYYDSAFTAGYYMFDGLPSNSYYIATVSTMCPNGTVRTSAIDVQVYGTPHTVTISSNGGYVFASDQYYTQPVDLAITVYEGQTLQTGFLSFVSDNYGLLSSLGLDASKWQLNHLYLDSVDILSPLNSSTSYYDYTVSHYQDYLDYYAYQINLQCNADHSIVAEFGPVVDVEQHTITVINHGGGYADDQMGGGYGYFTQDTNILTGTQNDYISLRVISMPGELAARYGFSADSSVLVRLVIDGEEIAIDGSDSRLFVGSSSNAYETYYSWYESFYFDGDHTIELWFEPWEGELQPATVDVTIDGEGYVYNMTEDYFLTDDTIISLPFSQQLGLQFVTLDPVVGDYNGFEDGCRLTSLVVDGEYIDLDGGDYYGDGFNVYVYDYAWNSGYILYNVYLDGWTGSNHTVHAVFGPYYDSTLCTKMTRMRLSEQYDTSAVVSWVAGNGTNTYHLYYGLAENFNYDSIAFNGEHTEQVITGDQEQFVYQMNGLQPSSHYIVMVKMTCDESGAWWYTYLNLYTSGAAHSITFSNNGGFVSDTNLKGRDTMFVSNYYEGWSYTTYLYSLTPELASMYDISADRCKLNEIIVDGVSIDLTVGDTNDNYMFAPETYAEEWTSYYFRIFYNADHTVQFVFGPADGQHIDEPQRDTVYTNMVVCDSYEWNGSVYTESGLYVDSVVEENIIHMTFLNLTVNYSNSSDTAAVDCNNFTWYGVAYGESGNYTNTFVNVNGCDSVVTLHLTVNNSTSSVANITACDSYTWHGVNYTASNNTASFDTVNAAGCDSTVTLNLTVNYSNTSSETRTACNSYVWHGNEYYASTDATYTTVNAAGCDSTVTLHLTVNQCSTTEIMACESYTWHGVEYYTSGTYVDGTDTLVLTVNYNNTGFEYAVACNSYLWHGMEFTADTIATFTATNADGCDSVITLWLFVNQCSTTDVTACGSYNWHGLELTSSGMYVDGFDTLNLTIKNGTTGDTIASACGSYNWYGDLYTESGNYTHVLTNASGCDSILTLHLTINECLTDYVTACGSYTWHGNTYTSSGIFNDGTDTLVLTLKRSTTGDTFAIVCNSMDEWYEHSDLTTSQSVTHTFEGVNRFGCDSIVTLHLVVRPCLNDTVTACGSYVWNGITYISSGTYRNGNNTLVLTINSATTGDTFATACNSYDWYEHTPTASGSYRHTIVNGNAAGCDSVVTLHLTVNHCSTTYATACDSYNWNGFALTSSGTYNMAYDTLVLTINHSNTGDTVAMACNGFTWHGVEYTEDTVATYTTTNAAGCDSTVSMHLMIMNCAVDTVTACNSYLWHGNTYTSSGTYHYDNETLILTVNRSTTGDTFATVCGYLEWNDVAYAESGNYVDTLTNAAGCDSVVTLHLTVKNCSRTVAEACDSYEWHELTFTSSGTYILGNDTLVLTIHRSSHGDTLAMATGSFDWYEYTGIDSSTNLSHLFPEANVYGCDSTVTLHLLVVNNSAAGGESGNDTVVACDSYNWRGFVISSTGVYPFNNDTLWLTIHRSNSGDTIAEACNSYEWYGVDYTESGNYTHTFTNVHGCDSIITLHLTVNQCSTADTAVCESYVWHGYTITSSGTYRDGRDTLILAVHRSNSGDTAAEACGSFSWYDVAYAESGNYTNTFTNAAGCDSVVTLHLTINECSTIDTAVCGSFTWRGYTLTSSGTYNIGFDTLNLTVKRSTTGFESVTAFNSYEWHDRVFTESTDTATYLTTNAAGCDSTVTLHLTVNQTSRLDTTVCDSMVWRGYTITSSGIYFEGFDTLALTVRRANSGIAIEQACNSFYWHGVDYTESGTYTFDTVNVWGCDSTARLYLTVNQCSTEEVTACGSYSWHNFTITSSGTYADGNDTLVLTIKQSSYGDTMATALGTFNWYEHLGVTETQNLTHTFVGANADGCDSTVTLHLTVFHGSSRDTVVCDSYTWHGNTFTSSGIYKNGYDTLYLTVNRSTTGTMTASACDSYTWNGTTYTESDTATFATLNVAGCDSVATLYLTINKPNNTATTQVACNSYTWNGNAYTESGDYTNSFSDGNGCTQVDTLHLTINSTVEATENVTVCDSYSLNGITYTESATIVSSGITVGGCDSIVTINLTVNHSVATADSVAVCDEYIFGGTTYTESAVIVSNGTAVNGCDSVATINLTVNHSVTTHDSITVHQSNLPITYLGEVINAAGDYEIHGSAAAGCDSTIYLHVTVSGIGIDVVNLDNVKLYPNPTRGKVTVTADNVEKIEVMNIVGRTVAVFTDTNVIDLSNLSEGSYTLRITLPEGNVIRKVIKR